MNLEPGKNEKKTAVPDKPTVLEIIKKLPGRLRRMLMHNLLWKLLAVFLSVCLWAGLITQDPTLTRERMFNDVPLTILGEDTLRRNGLIVLPNAESEPLNVDLRVDVPQREYTTVSTGTFNPRIDLSRITEPGRQTLKVSTTSTTTYGTVREVSPDSIDLVVDDYITSPVPVSIERSGQYPKGFYGTAPSLVAATVTVGGPKSIVSQISKVVVDFDVASLPAKAGSSRNALPMRFVDVYGNPVESALIDVTNAGVLMRSIIVEQTLFKTKTLPLSSLALTTGTPAAGYEVKSVTATPNILVAAGDDISLNALDALFLEQAVDLTGKSETFAVEVAIRQPPELIYLSQDSIMLTIEIGPIISSRRFDNLRLSIVDHSDQRSVHTDQRTVSVTLTGPISLLNGIRASALRAYVDVTELPAGEHELPIFLDIQDENQQQFTYDIAPKLAQVRVER